MGMTTNTASRDRARRPGRRTRCNTSSSVALRPNPKTVQTMLICNASTTRCLRSIDRLRSQMRVQRPPGTRSAKLMSHDELRPKEHVELLGRFQPVHEQEAERARRFARRCEIVAAEEGHGVEIVVALLVLEDDLLVHGNARFPAGLSNVEGLAEAQPEARKVFPVGGPLSLDVPELQAALFVQRAPRTRLRPGA